MIIDEVFMGGRAAQERLAAALSGVPVCGWEFSAIPTLSRPGSVLDWTGWLGWPAFKPGRVHEGVVYDLVVGGAAANAADCASAVASHLTLKD